MLNVPFPKGVRVLSVRAGREEPLLTICMTLPRGVADLLSATLGLAALVAGSDRLGAALAAICQEVVLEWTAQAREAGHPLPRPLCGLESLAAGAGSSDTAGPIHGPSAAKNAVGGFSRNGRATRD